MAKREMSDDHKEALAQGRAEGRAVRAYLEALDAHKPKRGRKRTVDSMQKQLAAVSAEIETADPLKKLQLVQQRIDLESDIEKAGNKVDLSAIEADFVQSAKGYADRKGISYNAWRELGVEAAVLKKAGISRAQ